MRAKIFFLLTISHIILLSSCTENKDVKIKKIIKKHLYETLHDYKSYEPISYSKIDSSFTEISDNALYIVTKRNIDSISEIVKEYQKEVERHIPISSEYDAKTIRYLLAQEQPYMDEWKSQQKLLDSISLYFKPEFNGWKVTHRFRSKNLAGNSKVSDETFVIDTEFTKVVYANENF